LTVSSFDIAKGAPGEERQGGLAGVERAKESFIVVHLICHMWAGLGCQERVTGMTTPLRNPG